jgi:7,8-dihydropterin-6-yl-methyl-4-(beta-D-ribofuranosyl)aminobenzene 5'-phosphate synthase
VKRSGESKFGCGSLFSRHISGGIQKIMENKGVRVFEVKGPDRICKGIDSTGVLGNGIKEQASIISTDRGLIVITGCAHPGIVHILQIVKKLNADNMLLVMGGFHLGAIGKVQLEEIITNFRKLGAEKVGPCHCTGDLGRRTFKQKYGEEVDRYY